jgi:L-threonylcarbamoyladenylate synthase
LASGRRASVRRASTTDQVSTDPSHRATPTDEQDEEPPVAEVIDVTGEGRGAGVKRAADALRAGQLVVLPTDTVYGVAADAFNLDGTARIFRAKEADRSAPLAVMVRSPKQLTGLTTRVSEVADRLVAAYWPGPLTLVIPAEPNLRWDLGANQATVAVRMPLDEVALDVVRAVGPLAVSSANRSGEPPATTAAEAAERFGDAVAMCLDDGPREHARLSTIVDLTRREPVVLRPGALPEDEVLAVARGEIDPFRVGQEGGAGPEGPAGQGSAGEGSGSTSDGAEHAEAAAERADRLRRDDELA